MYQYGDIVFWFSVLFVGVDWCMLICIDVIVVCCHRDMEDEVGCGELISCSGLDTCLFLLCFGLTLLLCEDVVQIYDIYSYHLY